MGKNKPEKGKPSGKDLKKEKLSVLAMDQKLDKPKTSSSSRSKDAPLAPSYTDGFDLPPDDDEEEEEEEDDVSDEEQRQMDASRTQRREQRQLDISVAHDHKQQKKREKKERLAYEDSVRAKTKDVEDNLDAFTIVIGSKTSVLEGEDTADANVKDISIDSFSVSVKGKELLKNVSVKLSHGKRYGLVGANGTGKSTLLKLLARRKIPVPKNIDMLLVEQEVVGDDRTALATVVSANEELVKLRKEVAALQKSSSGENVDGEDDDNTGEKLAELYDRLQILGSDAAEGQAAKILAGLGFTKEMQVDKTSSLSGGCKMRISLAKALFMQPTLLLLDEPTNHLDHSAVQWLQEYLCSLKHTLVVVSHNPGFLNTFCTDIIHLNDKNLNLYRGNYDDFERRFEKRCKEVNKKIVFQEKLDKEAKRSGNQAQLKKVKERAKEPEAQRKLIREYRVVFDFPEPTTVITSPLLKLDEVSFSYPDRSGFRLSNVDVSIDMETRVVIVGPNGAGKSTLLNLLAGDLVPTEGEVVRSQKLRIGRYSQHFENISDDETKETPVEYLLRLHSDQEEFSKASVVRAKLGKFGLLGHSHVTPIKDLSGGQKARVVFTSISMSKPHILLLDEPTNDLDPESINALVKALDEYTGGVVLVSHDSSFISRVCSKDEEKSEIWVVKDGTVKPCTFDEYEEDQLDDE